MAEIWKTGLMISIEIITNPTLMNYRMTLSRMPSLDLKLITAQSMQFLF